MKERKGDGLQDETGTERDRISNAPFSSGGNATRI